MPNKSEISQIPAIVLAGGLGTRLRSVINDTPKAMAPIDGKPFLHYVFQYLQKQGISKVILSVGYKSEAISDFFGTEYMDIIIQYSIEEEPLGTGGGIKKAFEFVEDFAFVLNGDTFFDVDLVALKDSFFSGDSDLALSLKMLKSMDRYGTVQLDEEGRVIRFEEKRFMKEGFINGGVYFFSKELFEDMSLPEKFSFEKDILEKFVAEKRFTGKDFEGYFIDIGVPEDYQKAQNELA